MLSYGTLNCQRIKSKQKHKASFAWSRNVAVRCKDIREAIRRAGLSTPGCSARASELIATITDEHRHDDDYRGIVA
jgi:hypothetical protein